VHWFEVTEETFSASFFVHLRFSDFAGGLLGASSRSPGALLPGQALPEDVRRFPLSSDSGQHFPPPSENTVFSSATPSTFFLLQEERPEYRLLGEALLQFYLNVLNGLAPPCLSPATLEALQDPPP